MSIILLTVLVLLVGAVTYMLLKRLVRPVRVVGACILMVFLAAFIVIVQNRETIVHDRGPVGYPTFQKISEEDHNFLDEILQKLNQDGQQQVEPALAPVQSISKAGIVGSGNEPNLKAELVINNTDVKLSEQVRHNETVKRAQLVMHNETFKRAELVRPRQQ
jgi:hypothetical protein